MATNPKQSNVNTPSNQAGKMAEKQQSPQSKSGIAGQSGSASQPRRDKSEY